MCNGIKYDTGSKPFLNNGLIKKHQSPVCLLYATNDDDICMSKQVYLHCKRIYVRKSCWGWRAVIILCIEHSHLKAESMWYNLNF